MQILNQFQSTFDSYLQDNFFKGHPSELYEPANYILSLGGKRFRPALLLSGCYLFEDIFEKALPAALAVEIFHNFSLVHDDIMDQAPLRRGNPTVHTKFGLNAGILSGDVMLVKAFELLQKTESNRISQLILSFTKMAVEVCEGQQMDMNFETQSVVTIPDYLKMIELKTAVLVGCSLELGALIGNASPEDSKLLYNFGKDLGIAFQIQDDVLDAYGDPKKFGKKTGGDIVQNKKTFMFLKALEIGTDEQVSELLELYDNRKIDEPKKISAVLNIFDSLNIKELTERVKDDYWKSAMNALNEVTCLKNRKQILEEFAKALMNREY